MRWIFFSIVNTAVLPDLGLIKSADVETEDHRYGATAATGGTTKGKHRF